MTLSHLIKGTTVEQKKRRVIIVTFLIAEAFLLVIWSMKATHAAPPYYEYSYYMQFNDLNKAYQLGCGQGTTDKNAGRYRDSIMVIDFGQPAFNGSEWGTYFPVTTTFISNNSIKWHAVNVARGYTQCLTNANSSTLTLVVGTTNNFGQTNYNHGYAWGNLIKDIINQVTTEGLAGHVTVEAGDDFETNWSSPSASKSWLDGYAASTSTAIYDYGDAGGCPEYNTTSTPRGCNSGWTQDDVRYVSWNGSAWPLPEIYNTTGANARQWQQISLYSLLHYSYRITIRGEMTQQIACDQKGGCVGINNTIAAGWDQLTAELSTTRDSRTAQSLEWSTDIQYQK